MKIIHCADIHLDSPLNTNMSERQANERNTEILQTFVRMTRYAQENGVRIVIVAGDLFDGERVKRRTVDEVLEAMKVTPKVDYLYLPGNHDNTTHAFFDHQIPDNLHIFTSKWGTQIYEEDEEVSISGIVITDQNADSLYERIPYTAGSFNIVVLHGQIASVSGVDQVNLKRLQGENIDYLALGHIHSHSAEKLDSAGYYCYPGCLEGRGFDECGEKGFILLDITNGRGSSEFIPFAQRKLHRIPVDITGLASNIEVVRKMDDAVAEISSDDMVEFVLTGQSDPRNDISAAYLQRLNRSKYFFSRVKDQSGIAINPDDFKNDISLKGAFIRLVLAGDGSDEEKAAIIKAGIAALSGEEIML